MWAPINDAIQRCHDEEVSREELSKSISQLKSEVDYLLNEKPHKRSEKGLQRNSSLPTIVELRGAQAEDASSQLSQEERRPLFRRCACGCGEMVLVGSEDVEGHWSPVPKASRQLESSVERVDPKAQREASERLHRRKERAADHDEPSEPELPSRRPDFERLNRMAKPRDRGPTAEQVAAAAGQRRQRSSSKPRASSKPRPVSHESGGSDSRSLRSRPSSEFGSTPGPLRQLQDGDCVVAPPEPVPSEPAPPSEAATLSQAVPRLRQALSKSLADMHGVDRLLESRRGRRLEPLSVAPALEDGWEPRKPRRTWQSQKKYTEARLYRPGGPPPGSTAALQQRLAALQAERREREAAAAC